MFEVNEKIIRGQRNIEAFAYNKYSPTVASATAQNTIKYPLTLFIQHNGLTQEKLLSKEVFLLSALV